MIDARRKVMLVGAATDEERHRAGRDILSRHSAEYALDFDLALGARQIRQRPQPLLCWYIGKQRIDVGNADARQHLGAVIGGEWKIAHFCCCSRWPSGLFRQT